MFGFFLAIYGFIKIVIRGLRDQKFRGLFYSVMIMFLIGTVFYSAVEKWSVIDSLFFSVVTLTTIGYGNNVPVTLIGKIFTIFYILVGLGLIAGFVSTIGSEQMRQRQLRQNKNTP